MIYLLPSALLATALLIPAATNADSIWNHNGSEMRLRANGSARTFLYERPRPGIASQGVESGTVLFEGTITEGRKDGFTFPAHPTYAGTAYLFSANCGNIAYEVSGTLQREGAQIEMSGKAPRRDRSTCELLGYRDDNLIFEFVRSEEPPVAYPPMVEGSICQINNYEDYQTCVEKEANKICRSRPEIEDLYRCFYPAIEEVHRKSLMEGTASNVLQIPFLSCSDGTCVLYGGGPMPYCERLDAKLVRECDGDPANNSCVNVECPLRACRKICRNI